jgi:multidrug efflux pump subunit AcrB
VWLTLLAVRNAIAVLMASLAVVVLGATSLGRLSMDLFPNINQPVVTIGTIYTGANVQDVEKTVTYPIEKAVSAVPGVRHVESRSRQGISAVQVWFNYDVDLAAGQNEIIQRIQQISNTLPSGIKQPFIVKFDLSNIPVCLLTVSGGGLDEKRLYDVAYNTIEPQIERINGVASANVDGGKIRQIAVNLDRDLLYSKAISVLDVVRSVNDSNFLMPSGDIKIGTVDYNLLTNNQFQLVKPMEDIVVRKVGDVPVRVRDLGYVSDSHEAQSSVVRVNGERAVYLRVNKQPAANTIEVVDAVKALVPKLIGVPPGVSVGLTFDQSTYIRQSINSLWHESIQGAMLAFLVILVFLRSFVSTTSFMGIIMMVGIVVSNGVLLIEYTNELRRRGLPLADAVVRAGRTRLRPILMTSLTTVCGLMPMALGWLVGGEANAPLARAVIGGLAVSTGFTLVLIPTLYTILEERFPRHVALEEGGAA